MNLAFGPTEPGIFVERLNRFVAVVKCRGQLLHAHIATSGRLWELLVPGADLLLEKSMNPGRRTPYSLRTVLHHGVWVSIDAQIPNRLMGRALKAGELRPFADCRFIRSEPAYGGGRFDFLLADNCGRPLYIEVKSVTLVEQKTGLFPDAPTERGRRHLNHLATLAAEGGRAAVIFVVQRSDAGRFAPNVKTDPEFGSALRRASVAGVEIYAYRCYVEPQGITLGERLPVMI
ncbi:MAG: DNA/RNA nuclease SfsA [Bacillota bacterium]|nr:DNA/RNA nuclease SfsA [Bacillota bacterium]MDW7682956.1 DNA/RNA nuclease SfsA [Bacillota bacterium]